MKQALNETPKITNFLHQCGAELESSNDVGRWGIVNKTSREYWLAKGNTTCQHKDDDFASSASWDSKASSYRYCQSSFFTHVHSLTGEKTERTWLCYSPSLGRLFCFHCKILASTPKSPLNDEGLSDWKHAEMLLSRHESSASHRQTLCTASSLKRAIGRIDSALVQQTETAKAYWRCVLHRIFSVCFLTKRGLPFRGHDEIIGSPHNGNYLGILELLSEYDDFLAQHIRQHGQCGRGNTSYLSSTTCEEFIELIGHHVFNRIIEEIKVAKYFSISVDSTPDVSHSDQLTTIIRYVPRSGEIKGPVERFLKFFEISNHTGVYLAETILSFLNEVGIKIENCCSQ